MLIFDLDREWQREVIESPARVKALFAGRGSGKTSAVGRVILVKTALEKTDKQCTYFSPSYATGVKEFKAILCCPELKQYIVRRQSAPFPMITFSSGSTVSFRSCDRDTTLLGQHLDLAVLDEVQALWEDLIDSVIRPQLTAKRGTLLLMGQFCEMGQLGYLFKRFYLRGQDASQDFYRSWIVPSSAGVMYSGPEGSAELERIRESTDPIPFARQYLAEPIAAANLAFPATHLKNCTQGEADLSPDPMHPYTAVLCVDIGRTVDPSSWVVVKPVSREKLHVVACGIRPIGEEHETTVQVVLDLQKRYHAASVIVDATGQAGAAGGTDGDPFAKFYRTKVLDCRAWYFSHKTKCEGAQRLQLALQQGRVTIPASLTQLHKQLELYRWEMKRGGLLSFAGPLGHQDDLVAALIMGLEAVQRGWYKQGGTLSAAVYTRG